MSGSEHDGRRLSHWEQGQGVRASQAESQSLTSALTLTLSQMRRWASQSLGTGPRGRD